MVRQSRIVLQNSRTDNCPDWPHGHPQTASILSSDGDYRFYRRFGTVRNLLLFRQQKKIADLEKQLQETYVNATNDDNNKAVEANREGIFQSIDSKLKNYGMKVKISVA